MHYGESDNSQKENTQTVRTASVSEVRQKGLSFTNRGEEARRTRCGKWDKKVA